jgi:hypothetical protein
MGAAATAAMEAAATTAVEAAATTAVEAAATTAVRAAASAAVTASASLREQRIRRAGQHGRGHEDKHNFRNVGFRHFRSLRPARLPQASHFATQY